MTDTSSVDASALTSAPAAELDLALNVDKVLMSGLNEEGEEVFRWVDASTVHATAAATDDRQTVESPSFLPAAPVTIEPEAAVDNDNSE